MLAGSSIWRRKRLSVADFESKEETTNLCKPSVPCNSLVATFQPEWKTEYLEYCFQPSMLRAVLWIASLWFIYDFCSVCFTCSPPTDGAGGDLSWILFTRFPQVIVSILLIAVSVLFGMPSLRTALSRRYDQICVYVIISAYTAMIFPSFVLELRRSRFQSPNHPHVQWSITHSSTDYIPIRFCNDSDPVQSWSNSSDQSPVGCSNSLLSGSFFGTMLMGNLSPMILRMSARAALTTCLLLSILFIVICLACGAQLSVFGFPLAVQFATGMLAALFCHRGDRRARAEFTVDKGLRYAAEQNANLLYTLIPRDVVAHCRASEGAGMVGRALQHVTIMFCALEGHAEMQAAFSERDFHLLNALFVEFDDAVCAHGMYKYQHVGEWYIVACPRAARPFDEEEQARPYPALHALQMLALADRLQRLAAGHRFLGAQAQLKVGIHGGPAAGAIVGAARAFYCLYGDAVNTAARMCKYAGRAPHASADFARAVREARPGLVRCESRGVRHIKGKGAMETFDIHLLPAFAPAVGFATQCAAGKAAAAEPSFEDGISVAAPGSAGSESPCWGSDFLCGASGPGCAVDAVTLSADGRRFVEDRAHRIDPFRKVFRDPAFERKFRVAILGTRRAAAASAALLHVLAVLLQWAQVLRPEYTYDFAALGAPELAAGLRKAADLLTHHLAVSLACTILLLGAACVGGARSGLWGPAFVAVKLAHLGVSLACYVLFPGDGWLVTFPTQVILLHGWMGALPFSSTTVMTVTATALYAIALPAIRPYSSSSLMVTRTVGMLMFAVGAVWLSAMADVGRRRRWRRHNLLGIELRQLREKLFDLLPMEVAQKMLRIPAVLPCDTCHAVVLQLDVCGFTALSQTLPPLEVAAMMHSLFSAFDKEVKKRGLFKMDTVGDAYICAGIVHASSRPAREVCEDILEVAAAMLRAVETFRTKEGAQVQCRIGVAAGSVVAGALGKLQPRFHIFGPGLRAAELCEQTGREGSVHVNHSFVEALNGGDCLWDSPGARCPTRYERSVSSPSSNPTPILVTKASSAELESPLTPSSLRRQVANASLERLSQRCRPGHVVWGNLRGEGEDDPSADVVQHEEAIFGGSRCLTIPGWVVTEWSTSRDARSISGPAIDGQPGQAPRKDEHQIQTQELVGSYLLVPEQRRGGYSMINLLPHIQEETVVEPLLQNGSPFCLNRYCGRNGLPALWAARVPRFRKESGPVLPTWANDPMSEQVFDNLNSKQDNMINSFLPGVCTIYPNTIAGKEEVCVPEDGCDNLWTVGRAS